MNYRHQIASLCKILVVTLRRQKWVCTEQEDGQLFPAVPLQPGEHVRERCLCSCLQRDDLVLSMLATHRQHINASA